MTEINDFAELHRLLKEELASLRKQDSQKKIQGWIMILATASGWIFAGWQKLNTYEVIERARAEFVSKEVYNQTIETMRQDMKDIKEALRELRVHNAPTRKD